MQDIETWVFDLDNTLYPASADLFALIDERMGAYISQLLDVDAKAARVVQKRYFREHGTTLAGLMADHGVDPYEFLHFVHDIALDRLTPDLALASAIRALPGRKLIFTNADRDYTARVLEKRGLAGCFDGVFDIIDADFAPKPQESAYTGFCATHDVNPASAIMFEDMARNLRPAKALGMATVWIDNGSEQAGDAPCPSFVDHHIHDLGEWIARLTENFDQ